MDPLWKAMSYLRRGKLEKCIDVCNELLTETPGDQACWLVRCKAVTRQNYLDDIELDEESIADIVMDENAVASMPR
jgi:tetratricopeptide repeat protein 8